MTTKESLRAKLEDTVYDWAVRFGLMGERKHHSHAIEKFVDRLIGNKWDTDDEPPIFSKLPEERECGCRLNCVDSNLKLICDCPCHKGEENCTCASFFTVRGVHKVDCPCHKSEGEKVSRSFAGVEREKEEFLTSAPTQDKGKRFDFPLGYEKSQVTQPSEDWESKFWKEVVPTLKLREETTGGFDEQGYLLNFISRLIATEREAERGRIIGIAEEMRRSMVESTLDDRRTYEVSGYNAALTDLLARIKG